MKRGTSTLKYKGKKVALAHGPVARVYYSKKTPCAGKPLRFWRLVAGKEKSSWHSLSEIHELNADASKMNKSARVHNSNSSKRFAIPTDDEIKAAQLYREFCKAQKKIGKSVPLLSEIVAVATGSKENWRDATPTLEKVSTEYIADKQLTKKLSSVHIKSLTQIFRFFAENFKDKKLADFTVDAVAKAIESKPELKNANSRRAYYSNIRALFKWWYRRENKSRSPAVRLTNPLENLDVPKLEKTEKSELISSKTLRQYLKLVREKKPELLTAVVLQAFCGLRRTDVMRLKWKDIGDKYIFLTPEVTGDRAACRAVPLPLCATEWLKLVKKKEPDSFIAFPELTGRDREKKVLAAKANFDAKCEIKLPRDALRNTAIINLSVRFGYICASQMCKLDSRTSNNHRHIVATINPNSATSQARAWFFVCPEKVLLKDDHHKEFQARVYAADVLYRRRLTPWYAVALEFLCRASVKGIDPYGLSPLDCVGADVAKRLKLPPSEKPDKSLVSLSRGPDEFSIAYLSGNRQEKINAKILSVAKSMKKEGLLKIVRTPSKNKKAPPLFIFRTLKVAGV